MLLMLGLCLQHSFTEKKKSMHFYIFLITTTEEKQQPSINHCEPGAFYKSRCKDKS